MHLINLACSKDTIVNVFCAHFTIYFWILTRQFSDHRYMLLEHSARTFQPEQAESIFSHDQCPMPCLRSCRRSRCLRGNA